MCQSLCVALPRIAAFLFTVLSAGLAAQQPPEALLSIKLTDTVGEAISGALVRVNSPSGETEALQKADARGESSIFLPRGLHSLLVSSRLFKPRTINLNLTGASNQFLQIVMEVDCGRALCQMVTIADGEHLNVHQAESPASTDPKDPGIARIIVEVTDETGAAIPSAQIELDPSLSKNGTSIATDRSGHAALEVSPGSYAVSITAEGFYRWNRQVDVQRDTDLAIVSTLAVAPSIDWYRVEMPEIPLEHPLLFETIPLLQLETLTVASTQAHSRRRAHWF